MKFKINDYLSRVYVTTHRNKEKKLEHRFKVVYKADGIILLPGEFTALGTNMVEIGCEFNDDRLHFTIIHKGDNELKYAVHPDLYCCYYNQYSTVIVYCLNETDHPIEIKKNDELVTFTVNEGCIRRYEYNTTKYRDEELKNSIFGKDSK